MNPRSVLAATAIAVTAMVAACHTTKDVDRANWPAANGMDGTLAVRMQGGSLFQLDSFAFTRAGLVGIRGVSESPRQSSVRLTTPVTLSYDSIAVVQLRRLDKQKTALALAAAATAGYIILAQTRNNVRPAAVSRPTVSCPLIYSFDGERWRLDSETYAGAIARGLERTDVDNLEHVRAINGRYRIVLANEMSETEYTDELSVIAAEHPIGTRVYPDASGALHLIGGESTPLSLTRRAVVSVPSRTKWSATFTKPHGTRFAVVLRVRNTDAVPFVHTRLANVLGRDVYAWYREINSNAATATRTAGWFTEMAGLRVSRETRGGWREEGIVPIVGPVVSKTMVVPVHADAASQTVRVQLESSPMLWQIESVRLATYLGEPKVNELKTVRAVDADGADVAPALRTRDGHYHVATNGNRVTIELDAPVAPAGMRHTILARTTGHYYVNSDDQRKGDPDLVARLMTRSAFSQGYFMLHYLSRPRGAGIL